MVKPGAGAVLSARELDFRYPDGTRALEAVDLHVGTGEFLCLLGPNGSGKSTLLKLFGGLYGPSAGRVRLKGEDLGWRRLRDARAPDGLSAGSPLL